MDKASGFLLGFMPSFNSDLLEQIEFAKRHFDFLELTLPYNLRPWSPEYIESVRKSLGKFSLVGHLHWDIDLTALDGEKNAKEGLQLFRKLGTSKVIIHPSFPENVGIDEALRKNMEALKALTDFCDPLNIDLLAENGDPTIPDIVEKLRYLTDQIPNLNIALDIGHAVNNWRKFAEVLQDKTKHLHLHYSDGVDDHLPFPDNIILKEIVDFWGNKNMTATLEIFRKKHGGTLKKIEGSKREKILLKQIEMARKRRFDVLILNKHF